ncbi:MAG: hypothetical protein Fur0041_03190 [Bacteroidia bacterium]
MNREKTSILILSCDKYADIWQVFFEFFFKFWADCPYKIYLGTNTLEHNNKRVNSIKSGEAKDWSTDTISILQQITEKYVIIILEDYFIYAHPDQQTLDKAIDLMEASGAVFMRLACFPSDHFSDYAYDTIPGNEPFVKTRDDARYKVNLQTGIWNREELIKLIIPGESPWDFEINASIRSKNNSKPFLGIKENKRLRYVHGPIPYLCTALSRGVWMRDALALARKNSISVDTGKRPVETVWAFWKRKLYHLMPFGTRKYMDYIASKTDRQS